jgi:hypothetical protein
VGRVRAPDALRDTLDRFNAGWRAVLAEVIADGRARAAGPVTTRRTPRRGWWTVLDGIGLHSTVHGQDVPPERATAWARRLAELELGVTLPGTRRRRCPARP